VAGIALVAILAALGVFFHLQGQNSNGSRESGASGMADQLVGSVAAPYLVAKSSPGGSRSAANGKPVNNVSARTWAARFRTSSDYFDFIVNAADSAYAGDGRAAFYVGKALLSCALVMKLYSGVGDPQTKFATDLMTLQYAPQWVRDQRTDEFHRCFRLVHADPFDHLPARADGYPSRYWFDQAVADQDPVAEVTRATDEISRAGAQNSGELNAETIDRVQDGIVAAVKSKDPDAIFRVGMLLSNASFSSDPMNGAALALAACDLGYDCSAQNSENVFSTCRTSGACPADANFADYLQQSLGPEKYAEAFARAQEFKEALARNDDPGIRAFTHIKSR
jgi:hypothetical protein